MSKCLAVVRVGWAPLELIDAQITMPLLSQTEPPASPLPHSQMIEIQKEVNPKKLELSSI